MKAQIVNTAFEPSISSGHDEVDMIITSPPYNMGTKYDVYNDSRSQTEYQKEVSKWVTLMSKMCPEGPVAINVGDYCQYSISDIWMNAMKQEFIPGPYIYREIIWDKGDHYVPDQSWGTFMSPEKPDIRLCHEKILLAIPTKRPLLAGEKCTCSENEFVMSTRSIWRINTEDDKGMGHPCPYPVEIPSRLINLFTSPGSLVMDPFAGTGTTGVACIRTGRQFIGFEISAFYVNIAKRRFEKEFRKKRPK